MKRKIGIRGNVILFFCLFVLISLAILWILRFVFFEGIYRETQISALRESATELKGRSDAYYHTFVNEKAANKSQCILIYDAQMNIVAGEHTPGQCVVHNLSKNTIQSLYEKTKALDDSYFETYLTSDDMDLIIGAKNAPQKFPFFPNYSEKELSNKGAYDCMFLCEIIQNNEASERFVLQSVVMIPLESTVDALTFEMVVVSMILVAVSVILSFILSDILSKPIIQLNRASKHLPGGHFSSASVRGYREVEELCDTLEAASVEISKTDRLRRELIANVSHDLRTPLTLISGYSEAMRDLPGENTPENLQIIIDETKRLSDLVTDLLDLSRLETNVDQNVMDEIDLVDLSRTIVDRFIKMLRKDGYHFHFITSLEHAMICADRGHISQVIYNLMTNAVNYCGEDKTVILKIFRENSNVRLEVIDHGSGIDPRALPDIWDRYYRVDSVHKSAKIGSGLGLSIVKKVLEAHRANYGVESKIGEGSCFWFSFNEVRRNS